MKNMNVLENDNALENSLDFWPEPAISIITQIDDAPTNAPVQSPRFHRAGGVTAAIYKRTQWTAPKGGPAVIARCDRAVESLFDPDNAVPEAAVAELEAIAKQERTKQERTEQEKKGDSPYVRAEVNLVSGYLKLRRFADAFATAQRLAQDEPALNIRRDERADIHMNCGISALRLFQYSPTPDVTILEIARQSYQAANEFCGGTRLGLLCWWARVELERGDRDEAERLWSSARALLASRPERQSDMQSILNKDETLAALNARFDEPDLMNKRKEQER